MEGVRMSSMNKVNESDWRLFRSRLPIICFIGKNTSILDSRLDLLM